MAHHGQLPSLFGPSDHIKHAAEIKAANEVLLSVLGPEAQEEFREQAQTEWIVHYYSVCGIRYLTQGPFSEGDARVYEQHLHEEPDDFREIGLYKRRVGQWESVA